MSRLEVIYPGSFDPLTLGHIDIVKRLCKHFRRVHVVVLINPSKKTWFTVDERLAILKKSLVPFRSRVRIDSYSGLLVNYARKIGVTLVARGLRAISDYDTELMMALANRDMHPNLETIFLITDKRYAFLTSSLVKEIAKHRGSVRRFVQPHVESALKRKILELKKHG